MRFVVDADIREGQARLRVVDADSGRTQIQWLLNKDTARIQQGEPGHVRLKQEPYTLQSLLRSLFLIACCDDLQAGANKNCYTISE